MKKHPGENTSVFSLRSRVQIYTSAQICDQLRGCAEIADRDAPPLWIVQLDQKINFRYIIYSNLLILEFVTLWGRSLYWSPIWIHLCWHVHMCCKWAAHCEWKPACLRCATAISGWTKSNHFYISKLTKMLPFWKPWSSAMMAPSKLRCFNPPCVEGVDCDWIHWFAVLAIWLERMRQIKGWTVMGRRSLTNTEPVVTVCLGIMTCLECCQALGNVSSSHHTCHNCNSCFHASRGQCDSSSVVHPSVPGNPKFTCLALNCSPSGVSFQSAWMGSPALRVMLPCLTLCSSSHCVSLPHFLPKITYSFQRGFGRCGGVSVTLFIWYQHRARACQSVTFEPRGGRFTTCFHFLLPFLKALSSRLLLEFFKTSMQCFTHLRKRFWHRLLERPIGAKFGGWTTKIFTTCF